MYASSGKSVCRANFGNFTHICTIFAIYNGVISIARLCYSKVLRAHNSFPFRPRRSCWKQKKSVTNAKYGIMKLCFCQARLKRFTLLTLRNFELMLICMTQQLMLFKGYCFLEYPTSEIAATAMAVLDGYILDKNHVFSTNTFADLHKFFDPDPQWKPPVPRPYTDFVRPSFPSSFDFRSSLP